MPQMTTDQSSSQPLSLKQKVVDGERMYVTTDGVAYPSVTTILNCLDKPGVMSWTVRKEIELYEDALHETHIRLPDTSSLNFVMQTNLAVARNRKERRTLEKAADIGTNVHERIEWMLRGDLGQKRGKKPELICDEAARAFRSFLDYRHGYDFKPLHVELQVHSKLYGYAGTIDWIALVDGILVVGDWKTSTKIQATAYLQVAAYAMAAIEMKIISAPVSISILRLPKDKESGEKAEISTVGWDELQEYCDVFHQVRVLYQWLKEKKGS